MFKVIKSASISAAALVFFLNFCGKADMNAVWLNIVIVGEEYLKIKFFHIPVGRMGNFFPGINVFKHTLKLKFKKARDVFRDVVIFSSTDQFPNFFQLFFCIIIIWCCSVDDRWSNSVLSGETICPKNTLSLISLYIFI